MKINELETTDIKSMLTSMESQIENTTGNAKEFLKEYYKEFIEQAKIEILKREKKNGETNN